MPNLESRDAVIVVLLILVLILMYKTRNVEPFSDTDRAEITDIINKTYNADVSAIRNLSGICNSIITAGDKLTLPIGEITAKNDMKVTNNLTSTKAFITDLTVTGKFNGMMQSFPTGSIILWHGTEATVPTGWKICDGTNGTPDLSGKFAIGASKDYTYKSTGGAHSQLIDVKQIPRHRHRLIHPESRKESLVAPNDFIQVQNDRGNSNSYILGGTSINDSIEPTLGTSGQYIYDSQNNPVNGFPLLDRWKFDEKESSEIVQQSLVTTPPYYALYYIMKV